ncbi:hypothetical protein C0J52_21440 [Blattella germanica]|nr:hypothetical protein C0J52_21440 [Blattella germanica]
MASVSRILSISVIASLFPYWTSLACAIHWLIMTSWLSILDRTNFCSSAQDQSTKKARLAELFFSAILGLVYIFTYLTPSEGRTRMRYSLYYGICFVENLVAAFMWAVYVDPSVHNTWYYLPLLIFAIVPFILGIIFMILYYLCFHPGVLPVSVKEMPSNSGSLTRATNASDQIEA